MGSGGKKKTTMAKLARENRLRERRLNKQAKRDARKQTSSDHPDAWEAPAETGMAQATPETAQAVAGMAQAIPGPALAAHEPAVQVAASDEQVSTSDHSDEAVHAFRQVAREPTDPRAKEVALHRLRDASDEQLAVFEGKFQADALAAGANEQEMRDAQRDHPGHDA